MMWEMFLNALKLFFRGKLFRDPKEVMKMWLAGFTVGLLVFLVLTVMGSPLWLAVLVTAVVGGLLQPYLFRNLKYD